MPLHKIPESATGRGTHGIVVRGTVEKTNGDGTVDFRVQDCGVYTRDGDLVRVRQSDVRHIDDYS